MPKPKLNKICCIILFSILGVLGIFNFTSNSDKDDFSYITTSSPLEKITESDSQLSQKSQPSQLPQSVNKTSPDLTGETIIQEVPFSPQTPFGEWSDPKQQDGCEEIAAIMAMRWVNKIKLARAEAKKELIAISDFELKKYKTYKDTSAADTAKRIFNDYYGYKKTEVIYDIGAEDVIKKLQDGNIIIVPLNGRAIKNPYYTRGGPERHMLLIKGYDPGKKQFITNDAGTRRGENFRYSEDAVFKSIRDYPSGDHIPITENRRAMIVVYPK